MDRTSADSVVLSSRQAALKELPLFLTAQVACQIEEALRKVGDFGEVRLVVVKGRLRFIQIMRSESVQDA